MSGIVERLRNISRGDHERGCQGREYVCSCDYDETSWRTAEEAADEIERLTRALSEARAESDLLQDVLDSRPAINAGLPETYIRWSQSIYSGDIVRAAIRQRAEGEGR